MYIKEQNFYISEAYKILFDLNQFRIFYITDSLCEYFNKRETNLNENEKETLNDIMASDAGKKLNETEYRAVKIHVSNMCNLHCKYCYAQGGNYGTQNAVMDMETAKKVVDFLHMEKKLEHIKYITFFGGEPLMNPDVIEYICENTHDINVKYLLQTNGTIISEKIVDMLKKYEIDLTISLDGPKEVNDFNRIDLQGNGTYNLILKNIQILKTNGVMPKAIEATLSDEFIEKYSKEEIADYIYEHTGIRNISVINDMNSERDEDIQKEVEEDVTLFFDRCLAEKYIMNDNVCRMLEIFLSGFSNDFICPAGTGILSISAKGEIFPCQLFLENKKWKMGEIQKGFSKELLYKYKKSERSNCRYCSAKSLCSTCLGVGINEVACVKNRVCQELKGDEREWQKS